MLLSPYGRLWVEEESIVYCTKCGTNNVDSRTVCVQCGVPLYGTSGKSRPYWNGGHYERDYSYHRRGRPYIGILIGLILILAGLSVLVSELYGIHIPWLPVVLILVGVFILLRLFHVRSRM
jgi:ribosomal protein L37E